MSSRLIAAAVAACVATSATAQDVKITKDMAEANFSIANQAFSISRIQDSTHVISGEFAKTSRDCPPFCIQPANVAPGVTTFEELEVIEFLKTTVQSGNGLLIDSRVPDWYVKGTIPGAVNVPFATLDPENDFRDDILMALGARKSGSTMDFSDALSLTLFCNGPWCGQSPRAIRNLLSAGYPAEKLNYYRGGIQNWLLLGLTIEQPPT